MGTTRRFTVGDPIRVTIEGEMTGITDDGTLTIQYPSELGACETTVELEGTEVTVDRIQTRDQARREVLRAALRSAAVCWPQPENDEADTLHRHVEIEDAIAGFDDALARYVRLAGA